MGSLSVGRSRVKTALKKGALALLGLVDFAAKILIGISKKI